MKRAPLHSSGAAALLALALAAGVPGTARAGTLSGGVDLLELHPSSAAGHVLMESSWTAGEGIPAFTLHLNAGIDTRPLYGELQVEELWNPAIAKGLRLAIGARQDVRPGEDLAHATFGIEADLLPGLYAEHYAYLSQRGELTGAAKMVVTLPLEEGIALEPRAELNWAARDNPLEAIGPGLVDTRFSMRLRRSLGERFDVYVGLVHWRLHGRSADYALSEGAPTRSSDVVIGGGFAF